MVRRRDTRLGAFGWSPLSVSGAAHQAVRVLEDEVAAAVGDVRVIELALTLVQGNVARAARLTGARRATVYRTLAALERPQGQVSHESCSIRGVRQKQQSKDASA